VLSEHSEKQYVPNGTYRKTVLPWARLLGARSAIPRAPHLSDEATRTVFWILDSKSLIL